MDSAQSDLDEIQAAAVARLRETAASDSSYAPADTPGESSHRRVGRPQLALVASLVLVAGGAAAILGNDEPDVSVAASSSPATNREAIASTSSVEPAAGSNVGDGARLLIERFDAVESDSIESPFPTLVLPVSLPAGWALGSVESSVSAGSVSVRVGFEQPVEENGPFPSVQVCITADDGCPTAAEPPDWEAVRLVTDSGQTVLMYGTSDALQAWSQTTWTTDPSLTRW